MFCPVCNNPMIVLEFEGVETDYCTDCEGIWLDSGELELFLDDSKDKHELLNSFKKGKKEVRKKDAAPSVIKKWGKPE